MMNKPINENVKKWNDDQLKAINERQDNVLVSASAGTGKTSTMLERILCSVREEKVALSELLILTFTNKSASDMKKKLHEKLIDYLKELNEKEKEGDENVAEERERIKNELDVLSLTDIGTIHSFFLNLTKQYFSELNISPALSILDEESRISYMNESFVAAKKEYNSKHSKEMMLFSMRFAMAKNDNAFKAFIDKIYTFAINQPQGLDWLEERISEYEKEPFDKHPALSAAVEKIRESAKSLSEELRNTLASFTDCVSPNSYVIKKLEYMCSHMQDFESVATFSEITGHVFGTMPKINNKDFVTPDYAKEKCAALEEKFKNVKNMIVSVCSLGTEEEEVLYRKMLADLRNVYEFLTIYDSLFKEKKREKGCIDFSDMEHFAVALIDKEDVRDELASKYKYVYIDEYQDVSPVQEYVLRKVCRNNLFMVGDVKQCIYLFRSASPEIMQEKAENYENNKGGRLIRFNTNYRSNQHVLDYVNEVFSLLMSKDFGGESYKEKSCLHTTVEHKRVSNVAAVNFVELENNAHVDNTDEAQEEGAKTTVGAPILTTVEDKKSTYSVKSDAKKEAMLVGLDYESMYLSYAIKELVGKKEIYIPETKTSRLIEYRDIMVLFRARAAAKYVCKYLKQAEIPYTAPKEKSNAANNDVDLLVTVLRLLVNGRDDFSLLSYLRNPLLMGFSDDDLAMIRLGNPLGFFYEAYYKPKVSDALAKKLKYSKKVLEEIRFFSSFGEVSDVFYRIIELTDFQNKLISRESGMERWYTLTSFINSLTGKDYAKDVASFVAYYDEVREKIEYGQPLAGDCNAVRLMTIHASKGLEAPIVFLINSERKFVNSTDASVILDRNYGIATGYYYDEAQNVKNGAIKTAIKVIKKRKDREEMLRLLYVALTRAQNHLFVVGEKQEPSDKNPEDMNSFMEWLTYCKSKRFSEMTANDCNFAEYSRELLFNLNQSTVIETVGVPSVNIDPILVADYKKSYEYVYPYENTVNMSIKYSVTELNGVSDENYVLTSLFGDEKANKGTLYHKVLEKLPFALNKKEEIEEKLNELVLENELTPKEKDSIDVEQVVKILYSDVLVYAADKTVEKEKPFMLYVEANKLLDTDVKEKILLQGVFDLLILGEKNILVDYKYSGLTDYELKEKYRKQLELYAFSAETLLGIKIDKKIILNLKTVKEIEI